MITVFSLPICPKCKLLKNHLEASKIPYIDASLTDLLEDADTMTELHMQGITFRAAPVLKVGESYHGPEEFFNGGNLDIKRLERLL